MALGRMQFTPKASFHTHTVHVAHIDQHVFKTEKNMFPQYKTAAAAP